MHKLGSLLGILCEGFSLCQKNQWPDFPVPLTPLDIVRKFSGNPSHTYISKVPKNILSPYHKLLFVFVMKNLVPGQECRNATVFLNLTLMELLDRGMKFNFPGVIFTKLGIKFSSLEYFSSYDAIDFYETRGTHLVDTPTPASTALDTDPSLVPNDTFK
ncbi:hypothetical protein HAX54_052948, partial [Datura stramonium]|nr:hypothetical protein [Datura stramonium]